MTRTDTDIRPVWLGLKAGGSTPLGVIFITRYSLEGHCDDYCNSLINQAS